MPIEGTPVDLLNPPAGCPFAPRCKNCMKICLSKMPPRTELSDTHYTYCWLQQKAAFEKGGKGRMSEHKTLVEVQHLQQYFPAGGVARTASMFRLWMT